MLAKDRCGIAKTQGPGAVREESRGYAGNCRCDVWPEREQTAISIRKPEGLMRLQRPHATLEERVIVQRWCNYLFIGPALKNRHGGLFDQPPQTGLLAGVVAQAVWNFGEWLRHRLKNLNLSFSFVEQLESAISFNAAQTVSSVLTPSPFGRELGRGLEYRAAQLRPPSPALLPKGEGRHQIASPVLLVQSSHHSIANKKEPAAQVCLAAGS